MSLPPINSARKQKQTFITHTNVQNLKYQLALQELEDPSGAHNTELEEQEQHLIEITDALKRAQADFEARTAKLEARERALEARRQALFRQKADVDLYAFRSKEKQSRNLKVIAKRYSDMSLALQEISSLTDAISGAAALLSILIERNKAYGEYGTFVTRVYKRLLTDNDGTYTPESTNFPPQAQRNDDIRALTNCMDYVLGVYSRLVKEESTSLELEQTLSTTYDNATRSFADAKTAHMATVAGLEQQVASLEMEIDALTLKQESLRTDNELFLFKLHAHTQEISGVQGAVKNLLERIAAVVEERHNFLTERASISDLLGGVSPALQEQVEKYYMEAKGLVNKDECFKRVLGSGLLARLRDIYCLGLALEDADELVRIVAEGFGDR
ncbi:hypothetical protein GMRT_15373 [Giardia muris]|uniref:DUF4200 domain-containing protein n=1 Tax=Giardia muris TaxID=5742 RepID=A0A4Z1SYH0_GIAMU|nr:hypothetical protein GMRT_15373 [Giardia muris]|eukprot:TNJ30726.1 hypothetical protein GMRT_15373 [Giardia muris]